MILFCVSATPPTIIFRSFRNLAGVLFMVLRCACGLDVIVKLICFAFLQLVNLVVMRHLSYNDWVLCELNCSNSFIRSFF